MDDLKPILKALCEVLYIKGVLSSVECDGIIDVIEKSKTGEELAENINDILGGVVNGY